VNSQYQQDVASLLLCLVLVLRTVLPFNYVLIQTQCPETVGVLADVMYVADAVGALVDSLCALSSPQTRIIMAHGRNRQAEAAFLNACAGRLNVADIPYDDLHHVYRCGDVRVCQLTLC
jgi:hypothetical protein